MRSESDASFVAGVKAFRAIELQVRDNCLTLFVLGIMIDNILNGYPLETSSGRVRARATTFPVREYHHEIAFTQWWVQELSKMLSGAFCQIGMLMIAGAHPVYFGLSFVLTTSRFRCEQCDPHTPALLACDELLQPENTVAASQLIDYF